MKTVNISPEVKTGIAGIISGIKKNATFREEILAFSKQMDDYLDSDEYKREIMRTIKEARADKAAMRKHLLDRVSGKLPKRRHNNPYAAIWPKDAPFYLPWYERIYKYLKFMFK